MYSTLSQIKYRHFLGEKNEKKSFKFQYKIIHYTCSAKWLDHVTMCYFFCYSSPNWHESLFVPLTNHRIKISSPHSRRPSLPAPPPHGQAHLCLSVSVTHMSLHPACQSPTKFPGSQYIWQYFISDLRISERISVQAGSLAWKFRSVWKARRLHDVGALQYPPVFSSYTIPSLSLSLALCCWFSCEWLPDTTLGNSSRS